MAFDNWPALLLARLFNRKAGLLVYRKNDVEILVDHRGGDENGTRACIVSNMYRRYLPFLNLSGPANVLDIGANGGGFPLMLKLAGIPLASLACVEMNPATWARLLVNLQSNFGASAVGVNAAVCGMNAPTELFLKPVRGNTGGSMAEETIAAESPHFTVKTRTLESLYDEYFHGQRVDICKIDIEGAEYGVLDSSGDGLLRRISHLFIEFHDDSKTPPVIRRLTQLGFLDITDQSKSRTGPAGEVRVFSRPN